MCVLLLRDRVSPLTYRYHLKSVGKRGLVSVSPSDTQSGGVKFVPRWGMLAAGSGTIGLMPYQWREHPAEVELEVSGETREELFATSLHVDQGSHA